MKITKEQLEYLATKYGLEYATVRAVQEVEAAGSGYHDPEMKYAKILFEPHVMYQRLTQKGLIEIRDRLRREHPGICYPKWGTYRYGPTSQQHARLGIAAKYHRETALESCSWGLGQVMGYHWKALGYESVQDFVTKMYQSEANQVEAMLKFIQVNRLDHHLKAKNWAAFARGYNGPGYAKNKYDIKLAAAYKKFAK